MCDDNFFFVSLYEVNENCYKKINDEQFYDQKFYGFYTESVKENQARLAAQFEEERNKLIENIKQLESQVKEYENRISGSSSPNDAQQNRLMSSLSNTFMKKGAGPAKGKTNDTKAVPSLDTSQQQVSKLLVSN